jgi:thiosulfate/3-mercaptopyruvate sulfurtransferase
MKRLVLLLVATIICGGLFAQKLISPAELSKMLYKPDVVIVDARKTADYDAKHIKNAISLDCSKLNTSEEGYLKDKNSIATMLGQHGITTSTKVVVYCKTGVNASRLYWVLKYMGCKDVSILDGQLTAWMDARKPVTNVAKKPKSVTFTPAVNSSIIIDKAGVQAKKSSALLIDTRKAEDYAGGKIGNAINIPHASLLATETKLKSTSALSTLFANKGVTKDKEIILYCKTSTTACLAYFVLTAQLGYTNVKVYDGAYNEWSK